MKQNTFFVNVWTLMLILGLIACGEKKTQVKTELQRIEAFAFDVNDDYLQSYAGTFCYSTWHTINIFLKKLRWGCSCL